MMPFRQIVSQMTMKMRFLCGIELYLFGILKPTYLIDLMNQIIPPKTYPGYQEDVHKVGTRSLSVEHLSLSPQLTRDSPLLDLSQVTAKEFFMCPLLRTSCTCKVASNHKMSQSYFCLFLASDQACAFGRGLTS